MFGGWTSTRTTNSSIDNQRGKPSISSRNAPSQQSLLALLKTQYHSFVETSNTKHHYPYETSDPSRGITMSILLLASTPIAIATSNATTATIGWVSDPTGRGTISLVFSCLLTLGLCVWSAMHLNIPPHEESSAQTLMRNLKWGLVGVFGPELVVLAAWRQYNSAKALHAEVMRQAEIMMPARRDEADNQTKVA